MRAAIDGVDAGRLVLASLENPDLVAPLQQAAAVDVIAAGKAAAAMLNAFAAATSVPLRHVLGIGPSRPQVLPEGAEWVAGGHPLPNDGSVTAARRARAIAEASHEGDLLVVLLSGGGSALMSLPVEGVTLGDKQRTARLLMEHGADIHELNTVRKHVSAIKGGQLAAAARGRVLTLAVSDVVGDDLSVIASGPTVPDHSTFHDAIDVLTRRGGQAQYPEAIVSRLLRGARGEVPETPKRSDPRLSRSTARVIGPQRGAIDGARTAAAALGYEVHVLPDPVTGEARVAGAAYVAALPSLAAEADRPLCVISSGETTVTVQGTGKGGRNQEFAFAMAEALATAAFARSRQIAAASIGTDGIDGPTDAAGAIVDTETLARAAGAGITDPRAYLDNNDTYTFFDRLGDLVRTGPTDTNVGDLQVVLIA